MLTQELRDQLDRLDKPLAIQIVMREKMLGGDRLLSVSDEELEKLELQCSKSS